MDNNRHGDKNVDVGQDAIHCFQVCLSLSPPRAIVGRTWDNF
jgi:hypothetical protein